MRKIRTALLAGVAAVALTGLAGAAMAQGPAVHVVTIALPGGGVEEIHYTGDVAPQIVFAPGPSGISAWAPMPAMFGPNSPFAAMERISAEMDRQAAGLLRQAEMLANEPGYGVGPLGEAAFGNLPAGSRGYSFIATMSGNGVCSRSMTITSQGNGAAPRVVTRNSGDCGSAAGGAGSVAAPMAPAPPHRPDVIEANAAGAPPYLGLVRPIAAQQR